MLSIGEVCEETGLSARTIRYYEEVGLLPGIRRRNGGRRVYGADELERVRFIQRLKTLGLSLAEIKELNAVYAIGGSTGAMLARLNDLLVAHLVDLDERIGELTGLREEMSRYREHVDGRIESLESAGSAESPPAEAGAGPPAKVAETPMTATTTTETTNTETTITGTTMGERK